MKTGAMVYPTPCKKSITPPFIPSSHPILTQCLNAHSILFSRSSSIQLNVKVSILDPCICTPSSNPFTLPFTHSLALSPTQQHNSPHTTPFSSLLPPCRSSPLFPVFILNVYVFFLPPPQKKKELVLSRSRCCSPQFPPCPHPTL